jgi:hypothetical protein
MKLYTVNQAADAAGVGHSTAYRWAKRKDMPMIGEQYVIPAPRFAAFVEFLKTRRGNRTPIGKQQSKRNSQAERRAMLGNLIRAIGER